MDEWRRIVGVVGILGMVASPVFPESECNECKCAKPPKYHVLPDFGGVEVASEEYLETVEREPVPDRRARRQKSARELKAAIGEIRRHCSKEWPSDFAMQKYCQEQQTKAAAKLGQLLPIPEELHQAFGECVRSWTEEDGIRDWQMIHYCYEQQYSAWKEIQ